MVNVEMKCSIDEKTANICINGETVTIYRKGKLGNFAPMGICIDGKVVSICIDGDTWKIFTDVEMVTLSNM